MLKRIDRIILFVQNVPAAVSYYRDTLGLRLHRAAPNLASFFLADGETELVLHSDADQPYEQTYYLVDDVRDLYRRRDALKLKFAQRPTAASHGYRAAVKDAMGNVLLLIDRTLSRGAPASVETAQPIPGGLFAGIEPQVSPKRNALIAAYTKIGRTADDLPYTPHFAALHDAYAAAFAETKPTQSQTWRHLLNLRKSGKLPKLGDARSEPVEISADALAVLKELLGPDLGKRDRLPYTPRFDALVDAFNRKQPKPLSPHLVWRVVAKIAK